MNNKYHYFLACTFFIVISAFFPSCKKSQTQVEQLPDPQIKSGMVKVYGKLNDPTSQVTSLILWSPTPVTANESIFETQVEKDGSFYFEVPIECSTVFSSIYSPGYGGFMIELSSGEDTKIELNLDNTNKLKEVNMTGNRLLTNQDKEYCAKAINRYADFHSIDVELVRKMTHEEYAQYELNTEMPKRIDYAMEGAKFSDAGKTFVLNELKLLQLGGGLLKYKERLEMLSGNKANESVQEPDIQYYSFLKSFNLDNPQYLYSSYYSKIMQTLLSREALNIPPISDTPVEEWLSKVKATLSDLLGFDSGQFYDLLAANAYAKQFNEEVTPLSDKQKNNIKEYFGDGEIAKILLRKNEEIIKLAERKSAVVVNKTPNVPKEE